MTAVADPARWTWQDLAACTSHSGLFYGPESETLEQKREREAQASLICRSCPVIGACLDHALSRPEKFGVWGGLGERERERVRRRRMRSRREHPTPDPEKLLPGQMLALGDMRILQGLTVGGYGLDTVSSWTRIPITTLSKVRSGKRRVWAASNSAKLRARIPDIVDQPPMRFRVTNAWALAQGWVGLPAWEGQDIDDPHSTPRNTYQEANMHHEESVDKVVAIHGTPARPASKERMEVRSVLYRIGQAKETVTHIGKHTPDQADPEHEQIRLDLERVEALLSRWDPGRGR